MTDNPLSEQLLAEHRPVLFRYALLQMRDAELADDAVQEALLSAWQSSASFAGKAGLRTWLIGILKHKIADHWRRSTNDVIFSDINQFDSEDADTDEDAFFMRNGHWHSGPSAWNDPEAAFKQQEFWAIYETCQNNLPPKMARVFMLRELVGLEADEVCQEIGLSEANYWVVMHRARLRLRECLEIRWFNSQKQEK
ncbi:sigma-70 family RNA polymerase sigma factor [Methylomonas methanica]|jgi:RNA polymerase sigma-70 factor (ECF subfamily)|uniref:RNA polymerase, sigma-24 subunit, ECF subfamily n=1 Tax=Methylomonas methanica (strain DSM 25384 / MC09) TaxID=857087 RepID=F9ZVT2_METMM|nr:sigma-70 family RNA polymerase sigma factor [Methylomonas methanica]AEF99560.1 RNA polymerase, sigma-24 subunit, ECF subfamily [Methylomonas methanica MC09]